jgi:hypothetical protein
VADLVDITERRVEAFLAPLVAIAPAQRSRVRQRPTRARITFVAAAFVLAASVIAILPLAGERVEVSAAARALEQAASVAAEQPVIAPAEHYSYSKTLTKERTTFGQEAPHTQYSATRYVTEELWLAPNGSGRVRTMSSALKFASAAARAQWGALDLADTISGTPSDRRFRLRRHFRDVSALPPDPERLMELLRSEAERASSGPRGVAPYESFEHLLWGRLVDLLATMNSEINTRPRLRAAVFRAVARFEGAELLGRMLDPLGRRGVGVAFTWDGWRSVLVFDPRSSKLLAFKSVLLEPAKDTYHREAKPGTWTAYLDSGRVDSLTARPRQR